MEGEKQVALPTKEQKGCTCTNVVSECPNGRHSMNLTSKSKPRLIWGGWGEGAKRRDKKNLENHLEKNLINMIMPLMKSHTTLGK